MLDKCKTTVAGADSHRPTSSHGLGTAGLSIKPAQRAQSPEAEKDRFLMISFEHLDLALPDTDSASEMLSDSSQ